MNLNPFRRSDTEERATDIVPFSNGFDVWAQAELANLYAGAITQNGVVTSYGQLPVEPIEDNFIGLIQGAIKRNGLIGGLIRVRCAVFSQVRLSYQRFENGQPTDLWGDGSLQSLEIPWIGGTLSDLLFKALMTADLAGNAYIVHDDDEYILLRPDWVDIVLQPRYLNRGRNGQAVRVGWKRVAYAYYEDGLRSNDPAIYLPEEICHFAPIPDPEASYRGMSWITPIIREIQADYIMNQHKLKFFENGASLNVAVVYPKEITPDKFKKLMEAMEDKHVGLSNAYKTLYLGGGADVKTIGQNLEQIDFKAVQGAGETRIAMAAGVHPVIAGLSEGLSGSSLNEGNFNAAKRIFHDITLSHLWGNFCGSMQTLAQPPKGSRLWYDGRNVPFLREDGQNAAQIQTQQSQTIRTLTDAGFEPDSVISAVLASDWRKLIHSGRYSTQLYPDGKANQ